MITIEDDRWAALEGGYRTAYDGRPVLRQLAKSMADPEAWKEVWNNLHHQGDVGVASYAAVVVMAELQSTSDHVHWNFYSFASAVETEGHKSSNPEVPAWLATDYCNAWKSIRNLASRDIQRTNDELVVRSIIGALALASGHLKLGALIADLDGSELDELLDEKLAWKEYYYDDVEPRLAP